MRQRKAKNMEERIAALSHYMIEDPFACKGKWHQVFGNEKNLYLELGCGKGQFLNARAAADSDGNFIGIEGQDSVVLRALEKSQLENIANLRFVNIFVKDIRDIFDDGELAGIYLNFSDPWPKKRHTKRRLTYGGHLERYKQVLKPEGFIAVKTDNDGLFEFTIEEIRRLNLEVKEYTTDLHNSQYTAREITTEYEDKFSGAGKNINYVKI